MKRYQRICVLDSSSPSWKTRYRGTCKGTSAPGAYPGIFYLSRLRSAMAQEGPNGAMVTEQDFSDKEKASVDAGQTGPLRGDSQRTNGDGSGSDHDSAGIRGQHQYGIESHAHSYSPNQTLSHQSHAEGTSRSSTPIQHSANYLHYPRDHHQLSASGVSGHEGFVQPSSYLRRTRAYSRPMVPPKQPETAVDREQRDSLVSGLCESWS